MVGEARRGDRLSDPALPSGEDVPQLRALFDELPDRRQAITSQRGAEEEVLGDFLDHVHAARLARVHREHGDDLPREL